MHLHFLQDLHGCGPATRHANLRDCVTLSSLSHVEVVSFSRDSRGLINVEHTSTHRHVTVIVVNNNSDVSG